jgi:hypothetical protein
MALSARHQTDRCARWLALAAWLSFALFLAASHAFRRFCIEVALIADRL